MEENISTRKPVATWLKIVKVFVLRTTISFLVLFLIPLLDHLPFSDSKIVTGFFIIIIFISIPIFISYYLVGKYLTEKDKLVIPTAVALIGPGLLLLVKGLSYLSYPMLFPIMYLGYPFIPFLTNTFFVLNDIKILNILISIIIQIVVGYASISIILKYRNKTIMKN